MTYNFVKTVMNDGVCTMTISDVKSLNALNTTILKEINDAVDNLNDDVRCLVITGDGPKAFVAGADISEMVNLDKAGGFEFGRFGAQVFRKIELLPIPVIAAVNGYALGGGCELAMACDIRIASSNAKFGQPEVGLGIIPGFSGTCRLPKIVGVGKAKELIFTGKTISANEALTIGLVNAVYEPEQLMSEVYKMATGILSKAPIAIKYAKECINAEQDLPADDAIAFENNIFGKCFDTTDQKDGMKAFLNKEKPVFHNN